MVKNQDKLQEPKDHKLILILVAVLIIFGVLAVYMGVKYFGPNKSDEISIKTESNIEKTSTTTKSAKSKKTKKAKKSEDLSKTASTGQSETISEKITEKINEKADPKKGTYEIAETVDIKVEGTPDNINVEQKTPKETGMFDLSNMLSDKTLESAAPLDQMPDRPKKISSPFASSQRDIIVVNESNLNNLKQEAMVTAGKFDPFSKGNTEEVLKPEGPKKVAQIDKLPSVPTTPHNVVLPPDLENLSPGFTGQPKTSIISNTLMSDDLIYDTYLTGIIGNAAVINFGGVTRALHAGQNYEGIVVLSVSPRSVVLMSNGRKVIRELRD